MVRGSNVIGIGISSLWGSARRPQRVLQPLGKRHEALAAQDHVRVTASDEWLEKGANLTPLWSTWLIPKCAEADSRGGFPSC